MATSASEMPAATTAKPPEPCVAISWKALMMPTTVPNRPMNGASEPIVPITQRPLLERGRGLLARRRQHRVRGPRARCSASADPRGRSLRWACARSRTASAPWPRRAAQRVDHRARQLAGPALEPAIAPELLDHDRDGDHRAQRQRVDGQAALVEQLQQGRRVEGRERRRGGRGAHRSLGHGIHWRCLLLGIRMRRSG